MTNPGREPPVAEVLVAPLLKRHVGSPDTDFRVSEHRELPREGDARGGVPLHSHRTEDEAWYVLEGTLRFRFGRHEFDAPTGSGVLLPHGVPHTFWNPGPGTARYLLMVRPKTAALLETLHAGGSYPENRKAVYAAFDVDLLE